MIWGNGHKFRRDKNERVGYKYFIYYVFIRFLTNDFCFST